MSGSAPRAQLMLPLRNRAAFLDAFFSKSAAAGDQSDQSGSGLFVPGELDVELGDEVDVELTFSEEQVRFHIRAVVKWKRSNVGRRALPPGIGIEFLASEARTQAQIVRFAEGKESVSHIDRERRWALHVDVQVTGETVQLTGTTDDLSEGGCFLSTDAPLEPGTKLSVKMRSPRALLFGWLTLQGFVAWRREQPGRNGVGIEFKFESERQKKKLKKIVEVWKERALRDVRIKVPRVTSTPPTEA